mgnify:CR=1 FL=1
MLGFRFFELENFDPIRLMKLGLPMPAVPQQTYLKTNTFSAPTAAIDPAYRAKVASDSIGPCRAENLVAAGYLEDQAGFVAFMNSKGNYGYQTSTSSDYTCTVRTQDGRGSGWVGHNVQDVAQFNAGEDIRVAMRKASASAGAQALEPGKYTVILEPAAADREAGRGESAAQRLYVSFNVHDRLFFFTPAFCKGGKP